jgi:NAD(P)-dependent dehydrogenase (short-subunit alcohol dehydrogenase family)
MSKIILVTGTSSGFGKLIVKTLAAKGHSVIATMRNSTTNNLEAADELAALDHVEVVELDIADEGSVNAGFKSVLNKYGHIDILVNNAGVVGFGLFEATSIAKMQAIFNINVWGTVRTTQAVLPSMRQNKSGLIINITSGLGIFAAPFVTPYAMSKFAVEGLAEGLRTEVRPCGIEIVTIPAGPFPTGIDAKAAGFSADKTDIMESYGPEAAAAFDKFGSEMIASIERTKADPQEIANAVLEVINLKPGNRPNSLVVNRMGLGAEQKYLDLKPSYKQEMFDGIGWSEFAK